MGRKNGTTDSFASAESETITHTEKKSRLKNVSHIHITLLLLKVIIVVLILQQNLYCVLHLEVFHTTSRESEDCAPHSSALGTRVDTKRDQAQWSFEQGNCCGKLFKQFSADVFLCLRNSTQQKNAPATNWDFNYHHQERFCDVGRRQEQREFSIVLFVAVYISCGFHGWRESSNE